MNENVTAVPVLVGVAEIAELAQTTKQAVCNWRDRYESFPEPLQVLRSGPIWDKSLVEAWLKQRM